MTMIEQKIEIVIPTYNRSNYLNKTLDSLLNSPFKDCSITIRDNASSDNTSQVCEKYLKLFKNLKIIRNKENIGGNANILRSYEQATMPYVWVLADNDLLNFDECDDFIEAIESEKYDLIICSSALYAYNNTKNPTFKTASKISNLLKQKSKSENYLENKAQDLLNIIENYYFTITLFMPSTIYKTSFINSSTLMKGYDLISLSFPHYPLLAKAINENSLTYKTKNDFVLLQDNPNDWEIGIFSYFTRRTSCAVLIDEKFVKYATKNISGGFAYNILSHIIVGKALNEKNIKTNCINLIGTMYKLKGWLIGFLYQIFIICCYFIPKSLCKYAYKYKKENV